IDKEMAAQRTGVRLEPLPELAPDAPPFPAAKAVVDGIPAPKIGWEVAPGRSRAGEIEDGFNEHAIAQRWGTPGAGFDSGKNGGKLCPCLVSQQQTYRHAVSSRMNGIEKT